LGCISIGSALSAGWTVDGRANETVESRFDLRGYASANYFAYDWQTDPGRRNAIDLERLTLYPTWRLDPRAQLVGEVEFEHGGTGSTVEFDRFEEFGEFEYEIEKGGEVLLEQLHLRYVHRDWFVVKLGRFKLPIGLASTHDEPSEYFTTTRSIAEATLIPVNWYENGIQLGGAAGRVEYTLSLVNGLDSSGFSSAAWVASGHQRRFEQVNAENLALCVTLAWRPRSELTLGASAYRGDSADNRPKPDLDVDAVVTVLDAHAEWGRGPWIVRALLLRGDLENADLVTKANRNLSNNLNVKRTPVGSAAQAVTAEAGFDLHSLLAALRRPLLLFARYESYDSMQEVEGAVIDLPRWDREAWTGGLNWRALDGAVLKAEYSRRELDIPNDNVEKTFSAGFGVEF